MKLISLFSGIGGFEIAAEAVGWDVALSCEINPFGRRVLQYHFPNAYHHDNVKTLTYETINEKLTERYGEWQSDDIVLTGGFPCQPFSSAGKRQGKDDERYLFPEMLRVIREVRPAWVVAENVRGLLSLGNGMVFDEVLTHLENEHYEVIPFVLPAAGVNAPHRRDRVWIIGRNAQNTVRGGRIHSQPIQERTEVREQRYTCAGNHNGICAEAGVTTDTVCTRYKSKQETDGRQEHIEERSAIRSASFGISEKRVVADKSRIARTNWYDFPTQPPICGGNDGIPRELDSITFPKWRNESIKAYGNAIVPQIAYRLFQTINAIQPFIAANVRKNV